nr:zinc finger, CCHC-type [Tanacetum cinerariifolium]
PIPPVPEAPEGQQVALEILAAHSAWVKGSKEIVGLMLMTIELEIQRNLEPLHAHEMLKELKLCLLNKQNRSFFRLREIFTLVGRKKGSQ